MSEERRETERKVEWRDEWKGTACDSSLKSLPVSVVHPQILGIACQLLPFVTPTHPTCKTMNPGTWNPRSYCRYGPSPCHFSPRSYITRLI